MYHQRLVYPSAYCVSNENFVKCRRDLRYPSAEQAGLFLVRTACSQFWLALKAALYYYIIVNRSERNDYASVVLL